MNMTANVLKYSRKNCTQLSFKLAKESAGRERLYQVSGGSRGGSGGRLNPSARPRHIL